MDYLLFRGEAPLTDAVQGTSTFCRRLSEPGVIRLEGADAREFDLKTRLFKHLCSYLIYSDAFQKLPADIKDYTLRACTPSCGAEGRAEFAHLTADDRQAIRESWPRPCRINRAIGSSPAGT